MDHMLHGCAVVGQSGGPTAAINATLAGVIRGAYNAEDGSLDTESLEDLINPSKNRHRANTMPVSGY